MSIKTDSFRGRSVLDCCEIESVFESRDRSHSQLLIYTSIRYSDIQLYLHMFIALYVHYIQVLSTPTQLHTARTQCLDPWSSTAWSYLECWRGPHSSTDSSSSCRVCLCRPAVVQLSTTARSHESQHHATPHILHPSHRRTSQNPADQRREHSAPDRECPVWEA